jgi:hypothetical protein
MMSGIATTHLSRVLVTGLESHGDRDSTNSYTPEPRAGWVSRLERMPWIDKLENQGQDTSARLKR